MTTITPYFATVRAETKTAEPTGQAGHNHYLLSLLDPTNPGMIPDQCVTPVSTKTVRLTVNLSGQSEYLLMYSGSSRRANKLLLGARTQVQGSTKNLIGFQTALPLDEDLSKNYTMGRVVSSMLEFFTSTIPNSVTPFDGRITATVFNSPIDFANLDPKDLTSYNSEFAVQNVSIMEGLVYRTFPTGTNLGFAPYIPSVNSSDTSQISGIPDSRCFTVSQNGRLPSLAYWNNITSSYTWFDSLGGTSDFLQGTPILGSATVDLTMSDLVVPAPTILTLTVCYLNVTGFYTAASTSSTVVTPGQPNFVIHHEHNSDFPCTRVILTANSLASSTIATASVAIRCNETMADNYHLPLMVARIMGFPAAASLTVSAVEQHELVPNTSLSREITARRGRPGHLNDLNLAMAYLRSGPLAKPLLTRSVFRQYKMAEAFLADADRISLHEGYALSWGDVWSGIKSVGRFAMKALPNALRSAGQSNWANIVENANPIIGISQSKNGKPLIEGFADSHQLIVLEMKLEDAKKMYPGQILSHNGVVYRILHANTLPKIQAMIADLPASESAAVNAAVKDWNVRNRAIMSVVNVSSTSSASTSSTSSLKEGYASSMATEMKEMKEVAATRPVLDQYDPEADAIDIINVLDFLSTPVLPRLNKFLSSGQVEGASIQGTKFPFVKPDGSASAGYITLTVKKVMIPGDGLFHYDEVKLARGVMYVSSNLTQNSEFITLCERFGSPNHYLSAITADPEQLDRVRQNSHFGAAVCTLRGIPVRGAISADVDPVTLILKPVAGVSAKVKEMMREKTSLLIAASDDDLPNIPTVSTVLMTGQQVTVMKLRSLAEIPLALMMPSWGGRDVTVESLKAAIEENKTKLAPKQYQDLKIALTKKNPPLATLKQIIQTRVRTVESDEKLRVEDAKGSDWKSVRSELEPLRKHFKTSALANDPSSNDGKEWAKLANHLIIGVQRSSLDEKVKESAINSIKANVFPSGASDYDLKETLQFTVPPKYYPLMAQIKTRKEQKKKTAKRGKRKTAMQRVTQVDQETMQYYKDLELPLGEDQEDEG